MEKKSFMIEEVELRALLIYKDNEYAITKLKTHMIRCKDNSFVTHYPDRCDLDGRRFFLLRIDRKKNAVIYAEQGRKEGELSGDCL